MPLRLGHPDGAALAAVLAEARLAAPTTAGIGTPGSTLEGIAPAGEQLTEHRAELGQGAGAFERVRRGLLQWRIHLGAAVGVVPPEAALRPGETVLLRIGLGPLTVLAPNRIVAVVDRPGRFGFAYATLPGHPEHGEEAFVVEGDGDDGPVTFGVAAWSRPGDLLTRLGRPVARRIQRRVTGAYLEAARRAAAGRVD